MRLALIPIDKANHLAYGALTSLIGSWVAVAAGQADSARVIGFAAACVVGVAKEAAEYLSNRQAHAAGLLPAHSVDWRDVMATCLGGLVVSGAP